MDYDINYFISKFEAIPSEQWCEARCTDAEGRHDVWGHCGETDEGATTDEAHNLYRLVRSYGYLGDICSGSEGSWGDNPKERVLKFLQYVKIQGGF